MKSWIDGTAALILLIFCAVGAYSTQQLPSSREAVGTAALPTLALVGMGVCALGILLQALRHHFVGSALPPQHVITKILLYFLFFATYLWGMTAIGTFLADFEDFPWQHGGGFAIATVLFLAISLYFLGRRKALELLLIPIISTLCLLVSFGWIFQVILP